MDTNLWIIVALLVGLGWDLVLRVIVDMLKAFPAQVANWLTNKRSFILRA